MLGYLPGLLHAWYVISLYPDVDYEQVPDSEGRVTYWYVQQGPEGQQQYRSQPGPKYGTMPNSGPTGGQFPGQQESGVQNNFQPQNGEGSSGGAPPPSYDQAIKGDNKVQKP